MDTGAPTSCHHTVSNRHEEYAPCSYEAPVHARLGALGWYGGVLNETRLQLATLGLCLTFL